MRVSASEALHTFVLSPPWTIPRAGSSSVSPREEIQYEW
jgi:hypothetical protein